MSIGAPRHHFRRTDSTSTRARELAEAGARHGTTVTAAEQTAGRGRQGRTWAAPPDKALLVSVVLRRLGPRPQLLPLAAGLAVCEASESLAPIRCQIKWPNDVMINDPLRASAQGGGREASSLRKVAGILVETRPAESWAVLGIGLNVAIAPEEFPPELRGTAVSLGGGATVEVAFTALTASLERWIEAPPESVLAGCRERDALRGRAVSWSGGRGTAAGIDDAGSLLVDAGGERVALDSGEVHLVVE